MQGTFFFILELFLGGFEIIGTRRRTKSSLVDLFLAIARGGRIEGIVVSLIILCWEVFARFL